MQSFSPRIFGTSSSASERPIQPLFSSFNRITHFVKNTFKWPLEMLCTSDLKPARSYSVIPLGCFKIKERIALLFLLNIGIEKVVGQETYLRRFGGDNDELFGAFTSISDGTVVAVGRTNSTGEGDYDWAIMRFRWQINTPIWSYTWGGVGIDEAKAIVVTDMGQIAIAGTTNSFGAGKFDGALSLWDLNGTKVWLKTIGGGEDDLIEALATESGAIIAAGNTQSSTAGHYDIILLKFSLSGDVLWAKIWGGTGDDRIWDIKRLSNGEYVTAGFSWSFGGNAETLIIKWAQNGTDLLRRIAGMVDTSDQAYTITLGENGEYVTGGSSVLGSMISSLVVCWDSVGTLLWAKNVSIGKDDPFTSAATSTDGGFIFGGISSESSILTADRIYDAHITGFDSNGTRLFTRVIGTSGNDGIAYVQLTEDSKLVVGGWIGDVLNRTDGMMAQLTTEVNMYNCTLVTDVLPNVTDVFGSMNVNNPSVSSLNWSHEVQDWSNVAEIAVNQTTQELCFPEPPPPPVTTGVVTTGNLTTGVATTGQVSSSESTNASGTTGFGASPSSSSTVQSPSSSTKESKSSTSSPATSSGLAGIIAGVVSAVALVCFAAIGAGFYIVRKRLRKDQTQNSVEMDGTQPVASTPASNSSPSTGRLSAQREEGMTKIGGRYGLVRKITREQAGELSEQTGIVIPFEEGAKKAKPLIGKGQFGKMRVALVLANDRYVGVKKVKGENEIAASKNEAALQEKLSSVKNVMPLLDSVEGTASSGEAALYQFMPLAGFGNGDTLQTALKIDRDPDRKKKVVTHVAKGVLTALSGMHALQITHLDLKNSNIVLDKDGNVFVIDFGCAVEAKDVNKLEESRGDIGYYSPSRLSFCRFASQSPNPKGLAVQETYSGVASDLWALGVMLTQLISGDNPLPDAKANVKLQSWDYDFMFKQINETLEKHKKQYPEICDLIQQLLEADKNSKIKAASLLKHKVFIAEENKFSSDEERQTIFKHLKTLIPPPKPSDDTDPATKQKEKETKSRATAENYGHYFKPSAQPPYQLSPQPPVYGHTPNVAPVPQAPEGESGYKLHN